MDFQIYKPVHFLIEHSHSCNIPGYLIVSPLASAATIHELPVPAQTQLGTTLAIATRIIEHLVKPLRIYCAQFAEGNEQLQFHVLPRTPEMTAAFLESRPQQEELIHGPVLLDWAREKYRSTRKGTWSMRASLIDAMRQFAVKPVLPLITEAIKPNKARKKYQQNPFTIREARAGDEEKLVSLFKTLDRETGHFLYEPGERNLTVKDQAELIKLFSESGSQVLFVATDKDKIAGFIGGTGGTARRNRHSMHIVIGVLSSHWRQSIGSRLIQSLENWAKQKHFHQIELTVMQHNSAARSLYEKSGFRYEGTKYNALLVDGKYINEFYMAKWI